MAKKRKSDFKDEGTESANTDASPNTRNPGDSESAARAEPAMHPPSGVLTLVEQIQDYAIFMTDPEGRGTSWNIGVKRLLGFEEPEFIGRNILPMIFTPEDIARGVPDAEFREAAETGRAANDRWMRRKDGAKFWAAGITAALRDETGALLGFMKVMRDQTDQKLMEEELRRSAVELADANRRKDEFLATLAHELRNPLAPIRTGLELMKFIQNDPKLLEETRETMERQLIQLITLVDDLLDVSRISRGILRLQRNRIQVQQIVQNAVEASRPLIDELKHTLHVDLPAEPLDLFASASRLAQVLSNLLNNAAKFTPANGQIWLTVVSEGDDVVISVRDNGIGIVPEMRERIFEMFAQIDDAATKRQSGLGIGLTLAKSIVEMHGGNIEVHSAGSMQGTEFRVRLPVTPPPDESAAGRRIVEQPPPIKLRVLIGDDDESAVNLLGRLVTTLGHEVRTVTDGHIAVETAEQFQPDMILLDLGLPGMSGLEVCRRIRREPWGRRMTIVAVTGRGQAADRRRTNEAGFDEHLVKPVQSADLERLFTRITAARSQRQGSEAS